MNRNVLQTDDYSEETATASKISHTCNLRTDQNPKECG